MGSETGRGDGGSADVETAVEVYRIIQQAYDILRAAPLPIDADLRERVLVAAVRINRGATELMTDMQGQARPAGADEDLVGAGGDGSSA